MRFFVLQWNFLQIRRGFGGDPISGEARMALRVLSYFNDYRSVGGWWEAMKWSFGPDWVEFVEEQRSKAA